MSAASTKNSATVPEPTPRVAQPAASAAGTMQHGGDRRQLAAECDAQPEEILDFSASINPLGPPEWLRPVVSRHLTEIRHYPEPRATILRETLAQRYGVPPTSIVTGNGLNEFFYILPRLPGIRRILIPAPAYQDYARGALACDVPVEYMPGTADYRVDLEGLAAAIRPGDLVYLGHPGNPAGHLLDQAAILDLARTQPEALFAIDEAFLDFTADAGSGSFLGAVSKLRQNLLVLKSFTKFYAIPGLRLGCVVAGETLVQQIDRMIPDWSVNSLAQAVGVSLVQDDDYAAATREAVSGWRSGLAEELGRIDGIDVLSGVANFLLCRVNRRPATPLEAAGTYPHSEAAALRHALLHRHRIAIRVCDNMPGLGDREFRVAVRTPSENARLLDALREVLGDPRADQTRTTAPAGERKSRTPAVMLQGTSSNAGKSVLTTALCRILLQDGLRVAPFKAQNMSLNSFVTADGREIARAQATQAAACRLAPDIRMSPILLKPNTERGSQVLVHGRPVAHMSVLEYQQYKATAFEAVRESYDSLASDYDVIVLEGAGSPGEVNLKHSDIVNMRMARHAQSPVLLVGDIDRGGVFAGFVGIMETLAEWERELVAGYIVNRFRGDATLLTDAFRYMREHTARDVLGVVPYISDPGIPEEDSVSFKAGVAGEPGGWSVRAAHANNGGAQARSGAPGRCLDIVVIDLPLISNFTDFDALALEPDVTLRFVSARHASTDIGRPDALILPGTKNTLADLADLRANGLAEPICQLAAQGYTEIIGICGGFQMLGAMIHDEAGVESTRGSLPGLDLLPMETGFASEKTLRQAALTHRLAGLTVRGYEIHHGQTRSSGGQVILESNGELCGLAAEGPEARVWGAYLHGIFDADEFRRWFLDRLRVRRGLEPLRTVQARYDLEPAFDRLAAVVREGLQMEKIYRMLGV